LKVFEKIDIFVIAYSLLLITLITIITVLVSGFLIKELTEATINALFTRQDSISRSVTWELVDGSRLLSRMLMAYDFSEDGRDYSQLFRNIKMQLPYSKLIYITVLNEDGTAAKSISNIELENNEDYIRRRRTGENRFIEFSNNIIISRGRTYQDSMNLNTLIPIFIDYYENMKIRMSLFMEMDISSILFNAKFNSSTLKNTKNEDYIVSMYTADMELVETTENYPRKIIETLPGDKDGEELLSEEEWMILKAKSNYHRTNNNIIELYNLVPTGFVIKGAYPYSVILSKVKYLNLLIVSISLIIFILLIVISSYSIRYRQIKERAILLQIETIHAKLNPHFIFNTLNSMVGLVFDKNYPKLLGSFKTLSTLLRSSLETGKDDVLLSEEIAYIRNYIEIQKLRYEDTFDFSCEIEDESLLHVYIPHFSIQPIIENCFTHAIAMNEDANKKNYIRIMVRRNGILMHIEIINNGYCDQETKIKLRKRLMGNDITKSEGHLGLALINKEIKLLYGRQFGLEVLDMDREDIFSIRLVLPAYNSRK
jgi:sensor histidine kinase YesM